MKEKLNESLNEDPSSSQKSRMRNPSAQVFITSFYRWISSPHSKLYDPALHLLVQKYIKLVFLEFICELRKLGVEIIYASLYRLILGTSRQTLQGAIDHFNFIKKTINKNPIFKWITLNAKNYFDVVFWKDPFNFIGIPASFEHPSNDNDISKKVKALWNIAVFFPKAVKRHFFVFILDYVIQLYKNKPKTLDPASEKVLSDVKIYSISWNKDYTKLLRIYNIL